VSADADRGKLTVALGLIVGFMVFEVVVGALVHSLALLSDAAHMLTDAGAIALSMKLDDEIVERARPGASPAAGVQGGRPHAPTHWRSP
jgi:hypothetical protein